jgi:hypothetical protein
MRQDARAGRRVQHTPELVVTLEIAAVACRLRCADLAFQSFLAARYADFAAATEPALTVDIMLVDQPPAAVAASWAGPYARIAGGERTLTIQGAGFNGAFDEVAGQGWIEQPAEAEPLETFLTAIYAARLLAHGGFLLHAATIIGKAGAFVFFGPSGSGKTTVSALVGEGIVTDEITAIRAGENGYMVSSVPWRGRPTSVPLAGLLRLTQARETTVTRLSPLQAVRQLLPSVFFSRLATAEVSRFFDIAAALTRAVPAFDLRFTPDPAFWRAVPGAV